MFPHGLFALPEGSIPAAASARPHVPERRVARFRNAGPDFVVLIDQMEGEPEISSADFAIHVVTQLDVDLRVIQAGAFQRSFPTPVGSHRVNPFDQFRVTPFDGGNIERGTARVEPLDFTDDIPSDCNGHRLINRGRSYH